MCILTLTKIYCMIYEYQTLVREVTTPTLPTFLASCLNLIAPKSAAKRGDVPLSLTEAIFCALATLLPRYPTLFRPEVSRIRLATRPYLAPTLSDSFAPSSLQDSARRLIVLLHLAAAKNAGGEEWSKAVRNTIQHIHVTADKVFRAVVEDWESAAGYIGEAVDTNMELAGGSSATDDLPPWTGIYAGVDRLTGLLAVLEEHIKGETFAPVSVPLGAIMDITTRMLSVAIPSPRDQSGGLRTHPAIDRDEREGLWGSMPQIHSATLRLIETVADRLQEAFVPLAAGALDQLTWIFPSGKNDITFRCRAYQLTRKILLLIGKSLDRRQTSKLVPIIRLCCKDLMPGAAYSAGSVTPSGSIAKGSSIQSLNGNMSQQTRILLPEGSSIQNRSAASELLPLLVSHLPQQHLDIPIRSLMERTAVLTHHSDALLACIMTPFIGKDGRAISSIMPYAAREFANEAIIELLLRPRMPVALGNYSVREAAAVEPEDDDMDMHQESSEEQYESHRDTGMQELSAHEETDLGNSSKKHGFGDALSSTSPSRHSAFSFSATDHPPPNIPHASSSSLSGSRQISTVVDEATHGLTTPARQMDHDDMRMDEESPDSSDESVHLTMELDTDSEDGVDG